MLGKVAFSNYLLPVFLILLELMGGGGVNLKLLSFKNLKLNFNGKNS
jgi:hypothetical protein